MDITKLFKAVRKAGHTVQDNGKHVMVFHKNGQDKVLVHVPHGGDGTYAVKGIIRNLKKNGFDF